MAAEWLKGYEATPASEANTPSMPEDDKYMAVGQLAKDFKDRWKGKKNLTNDEGDLR